MNLVAILDLETCAKLYVNVASALSEFKAVVEIYGTTAEYDLMIKVRTSTRDALSVVLNQIRTKTPSMTSTCPRSLRPSKMSTRSHSAHAPKTRKSREQKGKTIKYSRKWDFTEPVEFTHIFIFVVASIMVLVAGMDIALGDLWLGLSISVRSYGDHTPRIGEWCHLGFRSRLT